VTRHLHDMVDGSSDAFDRVIDLVYPQLAKIAHGQLRYRHFGQTMDTRGLVHETYLKMLQQGSVEWKDRQHFFAVSSRAMRQILVDHARRRNAQKRGSGEEVQELNEELLVSGEDSERVLELSSALDRLARIDTKLRDVVQHRFFGGLSEEETAEAMDISLRSVQRLWRRARVWLRGELAN
jgi:RNA polymerase sigma factor (TIGR02999 family)